MEEHLWRGAETQWRQAAGAYRLQQRESCCCIWAQIQGQQHPAILWKVEPLTHKDMHYEISKRGSSLTSSDEVFLLATPPCCSRVFTLIGLLSFLEVIQLDLWHTVSGSRTAAEFKGALRNLWLLSHSLGDCGIAAPTGLRCRSWSDLHIREWLK